MSQPPSQDEVNRQNEKLKDISIGAWIATLATSGTVAVVFYLAFEVLRTRFPKIYAPRTLLVPAKSKSEPLRGRFQWLFLPNNMNDDEVVDRCGPDSFGAIFFMRMMFRLFLGVSIIGVVLLFPIYGTGNVNNKGLNRIQIANVGQDQSARLWATLLLSLIFVAGTLYVIVTMLKKAAQLRHEFLLSPRQRNSLSGYTLLVRDIPSNLRDTSVLREMFERIAPGKVVHIVLVREVGGFDKIHKEEISFRDQVEKITTKYMANVNKSLTAEQKKQGLSAEVDALTGNSAAGADSVPDDLLQKLRPTRRKYFLFGPKIDVLDDTTTKMKRFLYGNDGNRIARKRKAAGEKVDGAAFVVFSDLYTPHVVSTTVLHGNPTLMADKQAVVEMEDVLWHNLGQHAEIRLVKGLIASVALSALIIFWAVISAFFASIAQLEKLANLASFLNWINDIPPAVKGLIQGLLPTIAIAVLFSLLPVILRFFTNFAGAMTTTAQEKKLLSQYYGFVFFNIFLIMTISGSVAATAAQLKDNPSKVLETLATTVPNVSTFYINYVTLLALSGPAGEILQIANLILKPLMLRFLGGTPRSIWRLSQPKLFLSGVPLANHSFIATIGIIYMTLAPMVALICMVYFGLWYLVYSYQMQYVYGTRLQTGGFYLHIATKQLFIGLYFHELVMIFMFITKTAWVQTALVALSILVTIAMHISYASPYTKLMNNVPAKAAVDIGREREIDMSDEVYNEFMKLENDGGRTAAKAAGGHGANAVGGKNKTPVPRVPGDEADESDEEEDKAVDSVNPVAPARTSSVAQPSPPRNNAIQVVVDADYAGRAHERADSNTTHRSGTADSLRQRPPRSGRIHPGVSGEDVTTAGQQLSPSKPQSPVSATSSNINGEELESMFLHPALRRMKALNVWIPKDARNVYATPAVVSLVDTIGEPIHQNTTMDINGNVHVPLEVLAQEHEDPDEDNDPFTSLDETRPQSPQTNNNGAAAAVDPSVDPPKKIGSPQPYEQPPQ